MTSPPLAAFHAAFGGRIYGAKPFIAAGEQPPTAAAAGHVSKRLVGYADGMAEVYHHPFVKAVASALRQRCRIPAGAVLVAGVSGGADSVALLRALAAIAPRNPWRLTLTVGHVQHHLRDDAEADAAFVAELAESLGLPMERRDVQPREAAAADGANLEAVARRLRYAELADIARACDADAVAVAHHGDDQLETLLMRLMRGSSITGMRGMPYRRALTREQPHPTPLLIRPMLGQSHAQAIAFLNDIGQPWREDSTNADLSRTRARLREQVLPVLRDMKPDVASQANRFAEHARDVSAVLRQAIAHAHRDVVRTPSDADGQSKRKGHATLDRAAARLLPRAVLVGLLRSSLMTAGAREDRLTRPAMQPLLRAVRDHVGGERRYEFANGVIATVTRDSITIAPPQQ